MKMVYRKAVEALLVFACLISGYLAIKNDVDFIEIVTERDQENLTTLLKETNSIYSYINGLFLLSQSDHPESTLDVVKSRSSSIYAGSSIRQTLLAQINLTNDQLKISDDVLAKSLQLFPEDIIVLTGSLIYTAHNNDYQGILFALKKFIGKSIIRNRVNITKGFTTKVSVTEGSVNSIYLSEQSFELVIGHGALITISDFLSKKRTIAEAENLGSHLESSLELNVKQLAHESSVKKIAKELVIFIALAGTRKPANF